MNHLITTFGLIILKSACIFGVTLNDYCRISSKNTPCYYRCERSRACGNTVSRFQHFTSFDQRHLENMVNVYRNRVAGGHYPGEPTAQNMYALMYDTECQFMAGCLMKTCLMNEVPLLISHDGTVLGYNGNGWITQREFTQSEYMNLIEDAVKSWYEQGLEETSKTQYIEHFDFTRPPRHFLQMMWGEAKRFGCAKITARIRDNRYYFGFACVFKPEATFHKNVAYVAGPIAAMCSKISSRYENLCENNEIDEYIPPFDLNSGYCFQKISFFHMLVICLCIINIPLKLISLH